MRLSPAGNGLNQLIAAPSRRYFERYLDAAEQSRQWLSPRSIRHKPAPGPKITHNCHSYNYEPKKHAICIYMDNPSLP